MSISLRSNADGSGTLLNGSTPVMEITAAGVVSLPNIAAGSSANQPVNLGQVIGVGQTWQDVTGSRSYGVTYTNNTGKPIMFSIPTGSGVGIVELFVDSMRVGFSMVTSGILATCSAIVPNGSTYRATVISGNPAVVWTELR